MLVVACVVAGLTVGVLGDFAAGDVPIRAGDVVTALILSPVSVTFGGRFAAESWAGHLFLVGGLLFWPVFVGLVALCIRTGRWQLWPALGLWCAQAFFDVVHRMLAIMSV